MKVIWYNRSSLQKTGKAVSDIAIRELQSHENQYFAQVIVD